VNPRVEVLEAELARLRKEIKSPFLERQNHLLQQSIKFLDGQLLESNGRNYALKSKVWDLENQLKQFKEDKEKINEMMNSLLQENINLKANKGEKPSISVELTLWQKIKYVIGDKCPKSYI
jgi:chromosome segregation ATPase